MNNLTSNQSTLYPWGHSRRINGYSEYFTRLFGGRVQKVSLDVGFTCPNRDGKIGTGGCTFCVNDAFNPSYCQPHKSITQQLQEGIEFHKVRYRRANKYLAYFQAYSNTYADVARLEQLYNEALSFPEVIGLVIGTRPDCINNEILTLLSKLQQKHFIVVEFGVESCYNDTLQRVNRGHTFEDSVNAIELAVSYGLRTGAHFIVGLPGDTRQRILDSIPIINQLPLTTIKFHQLQVFKDTKLEQEWRNNPDYVKLYSRDEYLDLAVQMVERLNPDFVIERIAGEVPPRFLASEPWGSERNFDVLRAFEALLAQRNTWQGRLYNKADLKL
jgi:radical SAM protein (TIGR01212 family)